jgi:chlorophyll synthase
MKKIEKIVNAMINQKVNLAGFSTVFLSVIAIRVFVEQFVSRSIPISFYDTVIEFIHNLYFFILSFLLLWLFISLILKVNPRKLAGVFSWAALLIVVPPLLDIIKTGGEVYWSFYIVSSWKDLQIQFLTVFGHLPSGIVYFGTKIVFITAIILLSGLVLIKTRNIWKTALAVVISYVILFFMGAFPTIFAYVYYIFNGKSLSSIQAFQIAQLFGSPNAIWGLSNLSVAYTFPYKLDIVYFPFLLLLLFIIFFRTSPQKFWAVLGNFRYPQVIYHSGLLLVGMGLGLLSYPGSFNLNIFSVFVIFTIFISIWLAWMTSVVVNDIEDLEIDRITNSQRPLPQSIFSLEEYKDFGVVCFLLSLLGGVTVGTNFFVLILVYQIIAWFYSSSPLRVKRFPIVATVVSAIASLMIVFMGFILMSSSQSIEGLSWRIILLLFLSYTLASPIKDFKDIEGDKKYGVWTIPVIFGDKNGRLVVSVGIFIAYMLSVFLLHELRLFWWAFMFSIITFSFLNFAKTEPRRLPWVILGIVGIYGMILVGIVFL